MHPDYSQEEGILVYDCFRDNLLTLSRDHRDLPLPERMEILRFVGKAVQEVHVKDCIP